ncbi:hypothetical protein ADIARSV_3832 [Arcticibacter svalbardensis MN12-7]|uniref:DUF3696 domain-containing protein n=1 Tax=Arcticibacter svalbardensis MN12-7 TaxID=1150600 RepID=R9GMG7_9SPHI|nr:DUF3696 domain-containing protein [Arcticibacter svalbardensis]EOR93032.1 hypothetical protein ADIARSV_3832 [Arcticibacter svalbardensis MN12-7]
MITRIAINNFKAFREAEINLNMLNLFTGLNGMGKSSFIQSMLLLRQSRSSIMTNGLILKGADSGIIDLGKGKDVYSSHADGDDIRFEIDIDNTLFLDLAFEYNADSDVLALSEKFKNIYNKGLNPSLFNNNFTYLKAERVGPEHYYKANLSAVQQKRFLGYKGENVPLFIALNKFEQVNLPSVLHENASTNNLISNLDAWLNDITPGSHVKSTYYPDLDIVKVGYHFDIGKDVTPEFSPVNVGFGFTYILPILTAILSAEKGHLIIIENPESHLHPQGQAKLGELFAKAANDGVQIIVESHSDHLFNGIRVAVKKQVINKDDVSVFYFERDINSDEHITTISEPIIESDGRISHSPNGFFDEFSKQLNSLIR